MIKNIFFLLVFTTTSQAASISLLVFSYNRPLQLYALLESVQKYITGIDHCTVIYRASNEAFEVPYLEIQSLFPDALFLKQDNPPEDFKRLTLQALEHFSDEYVVFAVDDIVVKDEVDIAQATALMELYGAYGFYLRLGKHLTYAYANYADQKLPPFLKDQEGICVWNFSEGPWDWGYAQSLDMTIYRSKEIFPWLRSLDYQNPNQLEYFLVLFAPYGTRGICYENSKIINLPINIVQTYTYSNSVHSYSPEQLLEYFTAGLKLDIDRLYRVRNSACHMFDAPIAFITR